MKKRNYTHVQALLPEIKAMLAEGKTQREVAEYYGLKDKYVVKQLLIRERRKERKLEAGILPRPKGRPRKDAAPRDIVAEQAYECFILSHYTYIITLSHRDNKDGSASGHFVSKLGRAAAEVTARFFAGSNSPSRCPAKTARLPQIQFSHRLRRC